MNGLTQEYLLSRFEYNPETGSLRWKLANARWKGKEAGAMHTGFRSKKYWRVTLEGKQVYAHRIIWMLVHGHEPDDIDHIDGNGLNNKLNNLRNVSHSQNMKNQKMHNTNTSGVSGVSYRKDLGKWRARVTKDGKPINIGIYATLEQASDARRLYIACNGYHENHGRMTA